MLKLAENRTCTGCTACVSICGKKCLEMQADENGFLYPRLTKPNECVSCGLCEKVCPVINSKKIRGQSTCYAAYSKNEELRMNSSSGGIFSEIANVFIRKNGIIYGATYTSDFIVKHIGINDKNELHRLYGAKYVQSDLNNIFKEVKKNLINNQNVLFVGTPCQVAGLKAYLQKNYEKLLCIDFVCHGVPAPTAWKEYVKYRALKDNKGEYPEKINMRSKNTGWSRYQYSNLYQYKNGISYSCLGGQDLFMKLFVGNYINRESCGNCSFKGAKSGSDITLGDFWGIWDIYPEFDDNKGVSAVMVNSPKGDTIFRSLSEKVVKKEVTLKDIVINNPSYMFSSEAELSRNIALTLIREGKMDEVAMLLKKNRNSGKIKKLLRRAKKVIKFFIINTRYGE